MGIVVLVIALAYFLFQIDGEDGLAEHSILGWVEVAYITTMLGNFDMNDFSSTGLASTLALKVGFYALTFLGTILSSNVLIAIIGDTFDRITDGQRLYGMRAKIHMIQKFDIYRRPACPGFLFFVKPRAEMEEDEWHGRLKEIGKRIGKGEATLANLVKAEVNTVKAEVSTVVNTVNAMQAKMNGMAQQIGRVENLLHTMADKES